MVVVGLLVSMMFAATAAVLENSTGNPGYVEDENLECQAVLSETPRTPGAYHLPIQASYKWTRCVQLDVDYELETVSLFTVPVTMADGPPAHLLAPGVARPGFTVPRAVFVVRDDAVYGQHTSRAIEIPLHGGDLSFTAVELIVGDLTGDGVRELVIPLIRDGWLAVIDVTMMAPLKWVRLRAGAQGVAMIEASVIERTDENTVPALYITSPALIDSRTKVRGRLVEAHALVGGEYTRIGSRWVTDGGEK